MLPGVGDHKRDGRCTEPGDKFKAGEFQARLLPPLEEDDEGCIHTARTWLFFFFLEVQAVFFHLNANIN